MSDFFLQFDSPLIFICLQIIFDLFAPLSSTPLFFAGFALFGKNIILYHFLANLVSFSLNFWLARLWGKRLVKKFVGQKNLDKIDRLGDRFGLRALIFLRLGQWYLNDFTSYAYGLTSIKFWPYFLVSFFSSLPLFWVWWFLLAPDLDNLLKFAFYWAALFLGFLLLVFLSQRLLYYFRSDKTAKN